jgi:hypothetical protein
MGWQLTEDKRKVQRMRRYRRPGQAPLREKEGASKWRDLARRETGADILLFTFWGGFQKVWVTSFFEFEDNRFRIIKKTINELCGLNIEQSDVEPLA